MRILCSGKETKAKRRKQKSALDYHPFSVHLTQHEPLRDFPSQWLRLGQTLVKSYRFFFFLYITDLLVTSIKCILSVHTESLEVSSTLGVQWASIVLLLEPVQYGQVHK